MSKFKAFQDLASTDLVVDHLSKIFLEISRSLDVPIPGAKALARWSDSRLRPLFFPSHTPPLSPTIHQSSTTLPSLHQNGTPRPNPPSTHHPPFQHLSDAHLRARNSLLLPRPCRARPLPPPGQRPLRARPHVQLQRREPESNACAFGKDQAGHGRETRGWWCGL